MADDLVPHPLVVQVGIGLHDSGSPALTDAVSALEAALANIDPSRGNEAAVVGTPSPAVLKDDLAGIQEKTEVAKQVVAQIDLGDLSLFAGYLGPHLERETRKWRLMFLDSRLRQWLVVPTDCVVAEHRQADDSAAFGQRDAVWVRGDAPVIRGHSPQTIEGRFLSGDFTRAAAIDGAPRGGPEGGATGLFCEATTPFCCIGSRSRK